MSVLERTEICVCVYKAPEQWGLYTYRGGFMKLPGALYTHTHTYFGLFPTDMGAALQSRYTKGALHIQRWLCTYRGNFVKPLGLYTYEGAFTKPLGAS